MIKYENDCVSCGLPCLGNECPNRHVPHYYCDRCGNELNSYFMIDEDMICNDCLATVAKEMFEYKEL